MKPIPICVIGAGRIAAVHVRSILESTRAAYSLSGAVEEDHKALAATEDDVNRTVVSIDRLLNELSEDISRQSSYVSRERSNMTALSIAIKNGELYGQGLSNRAFAAVAPSDGSPARVGVAPGGAAPGQHHEHRADGVDQANPGGEEGTGAGHLRGGGSGRQAHGAP